MESFNFPQGQTKALNTAAMITTTDARAICQQTLGTQCFAAASSPPVSNHCEAELVSQSLMNQLNVDEMHPYYGLHSILFLCVSNLNFSLTRHFFFFLVFFIFDDCSSEPCFCSLFQNLFLLHCFVILTGSSSPFFLVPLVPPVVVFCFFS